MASAPKLISVPRIGPRDHGRRMDLDEFAPAQVEPGYLYELENGVVVVDVPGVPHERVIEFVREELAFYRRANPGVINMVSGGSGSVVRAWALQSERHPDVSIYLSPPPSDDPQAWDDWMPDIVIEVVSKSSAKRDYERKPKDYFAVGVR
ncbi:MAG: Uma2 family endonuclease [Phycisphaerae bacterium]